MAQAEIPAAEAYPMRAIQSSLDFHLRTAQPRTQVLFRGVVLCETCIETAGGIIDYRNQLTSRPALFQPAKRGAILHHQLSETGAPLPPHMDGL